MLYQKSTRQDLSYLLVPETKEQKRCRRNRERYFNRRSALAARKFGPDIRISVLGRWYVVLAPCKRYGWLDPHCVFLSASKRVLKDLNKLPDYKEPST